MWLDKVIVGTTLAVSLMSSTTTLTQSTNLYRFRPGTGSHGDAANQRFVSLPSSYVQFEDEHAELRYGVLSEFFVESGLLDRISSTGRVDPFTPVRTLTSSPIDIPSGIPDQVAAIERSPQAQAIEWMLSATMLGRGRLGDLVGVKRQSVHAWERGGNISTEHLRKLMAVVDVLQRAHRLHSSPAALTAWLEGHPAESDASPATLIASGKIDEARLLAVISGTPGLAPRQGWSGAWRPRGEAFEEGSSENETLILPSFHGSWTE